MSELSLEELSLVTSALDVHLARSARSSKMYGPSERHGVVEWQYLLQQEDQNVAQFVTFGLWADGADRQFEGWASITTDAGARSTPVRRLQRDRLTPKTVQSKTFSEFVDETLARASFMMIDVQRSPTPSDYVDRPFVVRRQPPQAEATLELDL